MKSNSLLQAYKSIDNHAAVDHADAHRLIQMLMQGAIDKLLLAKGYMKDNEIEQKGIHISVAISIIDGLQASLDKEAGGKLADNLYHLYLYMMEQLVIANLENNIDKIDEVLELLKTIKTGWDGIRSEVRNSP